MERFIPVEIFRKKVIPLEVLPFYRNDRNFLYFFVWITSARVHVERKRKIYYYFPVPVFGAQKNTSTT